MTSSVYTNNDLQGIQQRIKKYIHGVEGDVSLDDICDLFKQYSYSPKDEALLNMPLPPMPPPLKKTFPLSVIPITTSPTATNHLIDTEIKNTIKKREEILSQYSHIEVIEKDIYHIPRQKDTLFWSIYIAFYGLNDYISIDRNYGVKELEIKKRIADDIQKNPAKYKQIIGYRISNTMKQEIISTLLTGQNEDTSIYCMICMMIYFNIQLWLVFPIHNNTGKFLKFELPDDGTTERTPHLLYVEETGSSSSKGRMYRYKIYLMDDVYIKEKQKYIEEHYILIDNYYKPLKGVSSYKTEELETIWKCLEKGGLIETTATTTNKKMKKAEMYEIISRHFTPFGK